MNCQDTAKLRTPLNEVCQTTDIGCVPATSGKPQCAPMPDELPLAYDKSTSTLWLFDCVTRDWIAHAKFSMDQLQDLNLDNIKNICDILKIGVYYNAGTGNIQGTVTLAEFTEKLLECLKLDTNVVAITQGEDNTIKISIEGLDGLPSTYIKGDNVWFTGTGKEGDPVVVHTYDPICEWPIKTQEEVDAATTKHLGACIEGGMFRVPYLEKEKICEARQLSREEAQAAGNNLKIVGCNEGETVRIPVPSGMFSSNSEYLCVPQTIGVPSGAPQSGTGPLRVGCNGELYAWLCDREVWQEVRFDPNALEKLNPENVTDICNNFRMMGWYSNIDGDPCVEEVKFTLRQLSDMIMQCPTSNCYRVFEESFYTCVGRDGRSRDLKFENVAPVRFSSDASLNQGLYIAVYRSNMFNWDYGSGVVTPAVTPQILPNTGVGECEIDLVNDDSICGKYFDVEVFAAVNRTPSSDAITGERYSVSCIAGVSTRSKDNIIEPIEPDPDNPIYSGTGIFTNGQSHLNYTTAAATLDSHSFGANGYHIPSNAGVGDYFTQTVVGKAMRSKHFFLAYGESKKIYLSFWMFILSQSSNIISSVPFNGYATAIVRSYRNLKF